MHLIGLLAWYEEKPEHLARTVSSLARIGATHVVAIDGAYMLYPDARPHSRPGQAEIITSTAQGAGLGVTIVLPTQTWLTQADKRTALFDYARLVGDNAGNDWGLVIDADEYVATDFDLKGFLSEQTRDVCEVRTELDEGDSNYTRRLFRITPTLRVEGSHDTYVDNTLGSVRYLKAPNRSNYDLVPSVDTRGDIVTVIHERASRSHGRNRSRQDYYDNRAVSPLES